MFEFPSSAHLDCYSIDGSSSNNDYIRYSNYDNQGSDIDTNINYFD